MQYSWLERLTKEGSVRESVRDEIYRDCSEMMSKEASEKTFKQYFAENLPKYVDIAGNTIFGLGAYGVYKGIENKIKDSRTMKQILANKQAILSDPELASYKEKAAARFDEIAKMFPNVATNKELSHRLVKSRLHSGFMAEDLQRLAATTKTAQVRPEVVAHILADSLSLVKEAGIGKVLDKNVLGSLAAITGASLLVGLGTGGVNVARKAMHDAKVKEQLEKSFHTAMKQSDVHNEPLHGNKEKARQAFETLAHFSPSTAVNPSAARWFMNHMVSQDLGTSIGAVKELSEIERNLKGTKGSGPFLEGFRAGTESTNFGGLFQRGVIEGTKSDSHSSKN